MNRPKSIALVDLSALFKTRYHGGQPSEAAFKVLADGSRSSVVAGFVKVGTACSGTVVFSYRKREYRIVPRETVTWWNPPLADVRSPPPVAATCA